MPVSLRDAAVAVFDAESPPSLAFVRSLGRAGIPVHVYCHTDWPAARLSRYVTRFRRCPDIEDASRFVPWLEAQVRSGCISRVAPTSDLIAWYLAELRGCFSAEVQAALPTQEAVLNVLFKDRFYKRATELGLATPVTTCPESLEELQDLAETLVYPAVVKPRSHVVGRLERGFVVGDAGELRCRYRPTAVPRGMRDVLARYPSLCLPVVQEYLPGAIEQLFSVSGLIAGDGGVIAHAGSRKRHQWPPRLGVGLTFEAWSDAHGLDVGRRVSQQLLGCGLFELELVFDRRTGDFVAIDLNPRAHGFIRFDIARGNDLPLLWASLCAGEVATASPPPGSNVTWVHSIPLHLSHWVNITLGPDRAAAAFAYAQDVRQASVDIVHDRADPLPSLSYGAKMLRHPGGLVRPFLEERRRQSATRSRSWDDT